MKLLYVGFNLYGQFIGSKEPEVDYFTEGEYEEDLIEIEFNHSFAFLLTEKGLVLNGERNSLSHQIIPVNIPKTIVGISANEDVALLLTDKSEIMKFCLEKFQTSPVPNFLSVENAKDNEDEDKIVKVQCEKTINVALSKNGSIFCIPNKLEFKYGQVKDICVGREHCLILTQDGKVCSFGRGSRGQLGHGDLEDLTEPKIVSELEGIKIKEISAGGWHSAALSCEGDLYTWGWNSNGQLGLCTAENCSEELIPVIASPRAVEIEDIQSHIVGIGCGNRHTVALLDNNKLYGCGWNKYHQLGLNLGVDNIVSFMYLYDLGNSKVVKIKCGPWSTALLIDK